MKKLLMCGAVAAMFGAMISSAQAAVVAPVAFDVTVTLTPICTATSFAPAALAFGAYTAFGAAVVATPISSTLTCTRGLTGMTAAFDTVGGDRTTASASTNATAEGVVAGLRYTMAATRSTTTTGTPASTAIIGSADVFAYQITGNMELGQAGTCAGPAACSGTQSRQLTITY